MSRGITDAVYNRYAYDREKREALGAWEKELSSLLFDDPANANMREHAATSTIQSQTAPTLIVA
jgi:hypothetical protein